MVTVVQRPQGHKIIDQSVNATVSAYDTDALVTFTNHALSTGDFVYIVSDIDEYNGFWYVTVVNADTFKISEYQDGPFVEYYQEADVEYYQTTAHEWSSAFLPIMYKCSNNRWPINEADVSRGINSSADDNGYTTLTLSGAISVVALDWIKISGALSEVNNIWQVAEVTGSLITITLPYDVNNDFIGGIVQKYYNNYQVRVNVYAGLNAIHPWQYRKPYELVGHLSLTPDGDNVTTFSISDLIRNKLNIRNQTTLFSLPLNLDFFTGFYITVAESYDSSDGYTIGTTESAITIDDFEGYAVAGKLPFKNTYSGDYSDYILTTGSPAQWLTSLSHLKAVTDRYFDISFIKNVYGAFQIIIKKYVQDYLTSTETIEYADNGVGVYRIPIVPDAQYDSFCVYAYSEGSPEVIIPPPDPDPVNVLAPLSSWTSNPELDRVAWGAGATRSLSTPGPGGGAGVEVSQYLYKEYNFTPGQSYTVTVMWTRDVTGSDTVPRYLRIDILDAFFFTHFNSVSPDYNSVGDASGTVTLTFTADIASDRVGVSLQHGGTQTTTILSAEMLVAGEAGDPIVIPATPPQTLTEEICIDIVDACDIAEGVSDQAIRLLEDGAYRLLE